LEAVRRGDSHPQPEATKELVMDDARRFTLAAQTSETRERMERLRRGDAIT